MTTVTDTVDADHIAAVREFNRRYTRLIGVLQEHLVDSDYSLTEARILFELAHFGPLDVVALRGALDLDPGYLSRILARFEEAGLVRRQRSDTDGRRQRVELTERGREVFTELDRRSDAGVRDLLDRHSPDQRALLINAMRTIARLLDGRAAAPFTIREPRPGDYGWVIARNAALYAAEYGWNGEYEALVARIVADFLQTREPHTERTWIAEVDGEPVGSVFCVREDDATARLRLLLVEPSARGLGVGSALVEECVRFATSAGYTSMVLWTNDVLTAARHIYMRAGFELVDTEPHHSFGKDLVGQTWRKAL
ncbi:bifunctional helix-turn-helix transcriptional regulator/GNAT family N-acetyltransferase [Nocardia sp. NPDC003482]